MSSPAAIARFPYPTETAESLGAQQKALHNLGELLMDAHADVNDASLETADVWKTDTAYKAISDVQSLSPQMKNDSKALESGAAAITKYIGHVEDARTRIDGVRTRYDAAVQDRNTANRNVPDWANNTFLRGEYTDGNQHVYDAAVTQLDSDFDAVIADLRTHSTTAVSVLESALDVLAPSNRRGVGNLEDVAYGAASEMLGLTGSQYEMRLREAGLLTGPDPDGLYQQWLDNAARRGIDPAVLVQLAKDHGITPEDFELLEGMEEVKDQDGKSFYLLPSDISGEDARRAVILTYILNCGTDYDKAGGDLKAGDHNDFDEVPYSSAELQRIIDRQGDNDWSYNEDVPFVNGNGGRMATTPNGMLMGLGGNWLQDIYSQQGGTTYGDIFMLNIDDTDDPYEVLRQTIRSGKANYQGDDGEIFPGSLDLDRLLHHEERHSQQWADEGYTHFLVSYGWEKATGGNQTEEGAGLHDGGYH